MAAGGECLHPGGLTFTEKMVQEASLPSASNILDAGCGAGNTVTWLREKGYTACGIDKHPGMDAAWIHKGVLENLPYEDSSFDAVISECTAFICGSTETMLQECFRILRENGLLLLADVYFREETSLPAFSDNRPVTMRNWQQMIEQCGFEIEQTEDVSAAWKPFVIEQLWAGRTLENLWGGCLADGQTNPAKYRPGYFLLRARKRSEKG